MNFPATIKNITPAKAQKILAEHGLQVSLDQSKNILDFLYNLAHQTLNNENSLSLHTGEYRRAS
jgi:hypothetical protein